MVVNDSLNRIRFVKLSFFGMIFVLFTSYLTNTTENTCYSCVFVGDGAHDLWTCFQGICNRICRIKHFFEDPRTFRVQILALYEIVVVVVVVAVAAWEGNVCANSPAVKRLRWSVKKNGLGV
jgi:hypothetical protein